MQKYNVMTYTQGEKHMGLFYTIPKPTEALVITGGLKSRTPDKPFKVVVGRGAWTMPFIHKVYRFHTGSYNVQIAIEAPSSNNVTIKVGANVVFRTGESEQDIISAASRFLGEEKEELRSIARDIFEGETRALVGTMTVEEMIKDRMALASNIVTNAEPKMLQLGWKIDSFQINSITDDNDHIRNLSQPELTRVRREAEIANSQAETEIARAYQQSQREQSVFQKETEIQVSANKMETAKALAEAEQSGDIARAEAGIELAKKQRALVNEQTSLKEIEYHNDVIVPAEAHAQQRKIESEAEAQARRILAQADADNDQVALQRLWIESLPGIIDAYAQGMSDSTIHFLGDGKDYNNILGNMITSFHALKDAGKIIDEKPSENRSETPSEKTTEKPTDGSSRIHI